MLHQRVNIFHLGGFSSAEELKDSYLEEEPGRCPKAAPLCPDHSSLVSASPPFPD